MSKLKDLKKNFEKKGFQSTSISMVNLSDWFLIESIRASIMSISIIILVFLSCFFSLIFSFYFHHVSHLFLYFNLFFQFCFSKRTPTGFVMNDVPYFNPVDSNSLWHCKASVSSHPLIFDFNPSVLRYHFWIDITAVYSIT